MRLRGIVVAGVVGWSVQVRADSAAELEAAGETAAKQGSYAEAIDNFKAADRLEPRASHACLIALAYTRRNLWPQAEIFRDRCHELARARGEQLPAWSDAADRQIQSAIERASANASIAEITITVEPADAEAVITVSSFAPDETFAPRAIHLPTGIHQLFASAPGYERGTQLVDIKDGTPRRVVITLHKTSDARAVLAATAPRPSRVPWVVMGTGVGVAAIGAILDATWYAHARSGYADSYDSAHEAHWETARDVVIGCYVAGAITAGIGIALKYTVFHNAEHVPAIAVEPHGSGAMLSVTWK